MRTLRLALIAALAAVATACGGTRELTGYTRDRAPDVDLAELPDLSRDGEPFRLVAPPDGLLVVFFGYTNCPDVCPTTLAELRRGLRQLDDDDAVRVDVVMISIDPERDRARLADFVSGFVPGAHAVALDDDPATLRDVATAFGVAYDVVTRPNGEVSVSHTDTSLFAVDDTGTLVLTWPHPVESDDIAGDLEQLLDDA